MQNQHYVPKFLLKNFADIDGRVYRYNKSTDIVGKVPPKHAASIMNFYEFEIRGKKISFEDRFQNIETKAAPSFRKIALNNSVANLTESERSSIANFIAAQAFRTQAFLGNLKEQPNRTEIGETLERLWESTFITVDIIENRHWVLLKIEHDDILYLGDQPVVLQHTKDPAGVRCLGFDILGVEAFLPISPKLAIYLPCRSTTEEIISFYRNGTQILESLWKSGLGMTIDAFTIQRDLRRAQHLYEAITTGKPAPCASESVLNLNYLQAAWSYQWLFSNKGDFTTAKMVLSESPQYRKAPETSLAKPAFIT
ncbi:DUF4238 domain-containing protein [Agrobacterium vitis]